MATNDNNRIARALYVSGQATADWLVGGMPFEIRCPTKPKWFSQGEIRRYRYNFESQLGTSLDPLRAPISDLHQIHHMRPVALNQAAVAVAGVAAVFANSIDGKKGELAHNCALDDCSYVVELLEPVCLPHEDLLHIAERVSTACMELFEEERVRKCVDAIASRLLRDGVLNNEYGLLDDILQTNLDGLRVEEGVPLLPWPDQQDLPSARYESFGNKVVPLNQARPFSG